MYSFWFLKKRIRIPEEPGWNPDLIDNRDYRHEELLGALIAPMWQPIDPNPEPLFPIKNQDGSSSCVGNMISKALGILEYYENKVYREGSAKDIYARRSNLTPGMYIREGMQLGVDYGCTLEHLIPSEGMNEDYMNRRREINGKFIPNEANLYTEEVAKVLKAKNYLYCGKTFDNFAALLDQKVPLCIGVAGTHEGWKNVSNGFVRPPRPGERIWYHALVIPPENKKGKNFGLIGGKKVIIGDNSWRPDWGLKGQFILTEEYMPHLYWDFYFKNLADNWRDKEPNTIEKPQYQFTRDLFYSLKNDEDVKWLQKCLKWYGTFPKDVPETGNYYWITMEAVQGFQKANEIVRPFEPGYGRCGPKTRARLNEIFK